MHIDYNRLQRLWMIFQMKNSNEYMKKCTTYQAIYNFTDNWTILCLRVNNLKIHLLCKNSFYVHTY